MFYTSAEKVEMLINYYRELIARRMSGDFVKIDPAITERARDLGFSRSSAWDYIKYARSCGMLDF